EKELAVLEAGIADGTLGKTPKVDLATYGAKLQELAKARTAASAEIEKKAAEEFLKKAAAEKGAVKTDSGLIFSDVEAGKGPSSSSWRSCKPPNPRHPQRRRSRRRRFRGSRTSFRPARSARRRRRLWARFRRSRRGREPSARRRAPRRSLRGACAASYRESVR